MFELFQKLVVNILNFGIFLNDNDRLILRFNYLLELFVITDTQIHVCNYLEYFDAHYLNEQKI